jgi:hypothetical protein
MELHHFNYASFPSDRDFSWSLTLADFVKKAPNNGVTGQLPLSATLMAGMLWSAAVQATQAVCDAINSTCEAWDH